MRVTVPAAAPAAPTADAPQRSAAGPSWLDGALVLVALALAFLLACFPAGNADLWQHLATGRLVANGQFPFGVDPFSALEPVPSWVNFAWLTDLLLYALYQVGGGTALVVAKSMLVTPLAAILGRLRRPGFGSGLSAVATVLVLLALAPALVLRPVVVSYLLFAVLLLLLHRRPRQAALWRLPLAVGVLFALWVNLDGSFPVGLLVLALWLAGELLQRVLPLSPSDPVDEPHTPAALALALAAAFVGCVVSPNLYHNFSVPSEFVPLVLPPALRADPIFESLFRSPFSKVWFSQHAGPAAALAYYLLLGLGLASFALNVGGWRWSRVLAWTALAWLSTYYWRLEPFFAMLAGPVLVWNVQAFAARQAAARAVPLSPAAAHTRAFLASTARVLVLVAGLALLALAWPGWLAAKSIQAQRRVGWGIPTDPTLERMTKRMAGWYDAGQLDSRTARGFHMVPDFTYYCAWFCPAEKAIFDYRLTAPAEAIADYVRLGLQWRALAVPVAPGAGAPPESPDRLMRKYDLTHLVVTGPPALEGGVAQALFAQPRCWPPWAIEGRGVVVGWPDPARPRPGPPPIDPVQLAVGAGTVKLPPPDKVLPPPEASLWDRYRANPTPVPPEAAESALWLVYRDAAVQRGGLAAGIWQTSALLGRAAPPAVPDFATPWLDARAALLGSWLHAPDGRAARAAGVLAVRDARRAVRGAPDNYEGYLRLALAYRSFDTDETVGRLQQIAALKLALERLPAAETLGQFVVPDERLMREMLLGLYQRSAIPAGGSQPLDLILESLEPYAELLPLVVGRALAAMPPEEQEARGKAAEAEYQSLQKQVDGLSQEVKRRRDDLETAAAKAPPPARAVMACQRGLVREALSALEELDPKDLDPESPNNRVMIPLLQLRAHLLLLAGDAPAARELLQSEKLNPLTVLPPQLQADFRMLHIQTAAVLGDYDTALTYLTEATAMRTFQRDAAYPLAAALQSLVAPDLSPAHPLTRVLTAPSWAGWAQGNPQQPAWHGDLYQLYYLEQQQANWQGLSGILALEQGDVERARDGLTQSLQTAGPYLNFPLRGAVHGWQELFHEHSH